MLEAVDSLQPPHFFKSKAIILAKYGKKKAEVWFYPFQLRKIFINPMSRLLLAKRLMNGLK